MSVIEHSILATDLALHFSNLKSLKNMAENKEVNWSSNEDISMVTAALMTASDLGAMTKPWDYQQKVYQESIQRMFIECKSAFKKDFKTLLFLSLNCKYFHHIIYCNQIRRLSFRKFCKYLYRLTIYDVWFTRLQN